MSKPTTKLKTWRKKMWVHVVNGKIDGFRGHPYLYAQKREANRTACKSTVVPVIVTIEPVKRRKK